MIIVYGQESLCWIMQRAFRNVHMLEGYILLLYSRNRAPLGSFRRIVGDIIFHIREGMGLLQFRDHDTDLLLFMRRQCSEKCQFE